MKTKTFLFTALCICMMALATGCGSKGNVLKGTIDEIKDFMFVVTAEDGNFYAMSFEEKPEGLEDVKEGDRVEVRYTGELSVVDPFTGEVLSVKKIE